MNYKYKCGYKIINVWVWDDDWHTEVSVADDVTNKSYDRTIREDAEGKFFTWNKEKIYLDKWIRISMKELKQKIENDEWVISDDLCQAVMTDGIENAKFLVPFNTVCASLCGITMLDGNKYKDVECKIEPRWNRELKDNYKFILVPTEEDNTVASSQDMYVCDMLSLIQSGHIKIVA
jgi:hypothetical protein